MPACTVEPLSGEGEVLSTENEQSSGARRILASGTTARKWLFGIMLAGVAAAITSYVTGGVTSSVDRARGLVQEEPAPVAVTVSHAAKRGSGHWFFAGSLASIKALPLPTTELGSLETWNAWAQEHGGVDADMTAVDVIVEGDTPYPVVLTGLTVDVVERSVPAQGVHVVPFGGGPVSVRFFEVVLDKNPPAVTSVPPEFDPGPAVDFPYRVSQAEPEVFYINAYALRCDCSWRATLDWVYQGKRGTTVIDDDGKPFRTVAGVKSAQYYPKFDRG